MSAEITPPPPQPLHLVLWRGLEPGYYLVLGTAFLGGLLFVLFDVSWGRVLLAVCGLLLLVVLVLPYRGMRLWRWGWLRLRHWWAVLLALFYPARRRQVAALASRLLEAAPPKAQRASVARTGAETRPLALPDACEGNRLDWDPAWTAAWCASAAPPSPRAHPASSTPDGVPFPALSATNGHPQRLRPVLAQDELDGESAPLMGTPALATDPAGPEEPAGRSADPATLTLRQIRAWRQAPAGTRRTL